MELWEDTTRLSEKFTSFSQLNLGLSLIATTLHFLQQDMGMIITLTAITLLNIIPLWKRKTYERNRNKTATEGSSGLVEDDKRAENPNQSDSAKDAADN